LCATKNLKKPTFEPRSGFHSECFDIYIVYFQKRAPTGAEKRDGLEPEKRHANRGRILAFKRSNFSLLVAEYEVTSREKWAPFCSTQNGTSDKCFKKNNRKKKIIFFLKKPHSFSSLSRKFRSSSFHLPRCFSSPFLLHHCCPLKLQTLLFISTPNCKGKPFSESWSAPLRCGT